MTRCGLTQEQAAQKLGKSRSALANSLRLLNLPENVLELLKSGFINIGHAKVILSLPTPELQEQAAQIIADNQLNVRQAEALCKKLAKPTKEPREPKPRGTLPVEVEESLKQVLGSEVNVAYHDGKGRLTVHFYSDEQLRAFCQPAGTVPERRIKAIQRRGDRLLNGTGEGIFCANRNRARRVNHA